MGQTIQDRQLKVLAMCDAVQLLQQMKDHGCAPGTQGHAAYAHLERAYSRKASQRLLDEAMSDFRFVFSVRLAKAQKAQAHAEPQTDRTIGFDYENQAWVIDGRYVSCGHPETMNCNCFGRIHAGESPAANADIH